jgi:alkylhydroperoxidase family enzyme
MSYTPPLLDKESALELGKENGIDDYIAGMNLFRALLHHPGLAKELNSTIMSLVSHAKTLDDSLREIIIMRVSWLADCNYEWSQHWMASLFFGLSEEKLMAIRDWESHSTLFEEHEQSVLKTTDELVNDNHVSPETRAELQKHFPDFKQQIEVMTCIGNWHMFALLLNGLEIPLEEEMESWPNDQQGPE